MKICLTFRNQNDGPHYFLHCLLPAFSQSPGRSARVLNNTDPQTVCFSSDSKSTCLKSEVLHPLWMFLKVGALLSGAYYYYAVHYLSRGKEDDAKKTESNNQTTEKSGTGVSPASNSVSTHNKCPVREKARQEGLVLYDGDWYHVAKFVPYHPGGEEILLQYLGSDISFVFRVMHRDPVKIMKHRKPVRAATTEEMKALSTRREEICHEMMEDHRANSTSRTESSSWSSKDRAKLKFNLEAFEKDANELHQQFVNDGYFSPTRFFLIYETARSLLCLSLSILCMKMSTATESTESNAILLYILPGTFLGLFWHQSGFLMHDAEHHNFVGNERINEILGWIYGTVNLGVNGAWWREEHRDHHALLNSFDDEGVKDPQMKEDVWIQNKKIIPFYGQQLVHFLANFQHILFVPIILIFGRAGIIIDSTVTERKFRPWTLLGNVLHILLHYCILSQTNYPLQVYAIASLQFAILSLQLLGNHYTKPFHRVHTVTEGNYFLWQVLCTQDFACPKWARWYYGGLNFHYSHHLFPTLSREYFHITTPRIQELCEKHGLPFIEIGFFDCVAEMITNFNEVRKDFGKHGSGSYLI